MLLFGINDNILSPNLYFLGVSQYQKYIELYKEINISFKIIEETQVLVESIEDDVWEGEYEKTDFLIDIFESWGLLCLWIKLMYLTMMSAG